MLPPLPPPSEGSDLSTAPPPPIGDPVVAPVEKSGIVASRGFAVAAAVVVLAGVESETVVVVVVVVSVQRG